MVDARAMAGFTLVELLVVVTIVAILLGIGVPGFGSVIASNRLKATSSNLHLSLLKARSEAVKRNTSVTMERIGATWEGGWVVDETAGIAACKLNLSLCLSHQGAVNGVAITGAPASVVYQRTGRTTAGVDVDFEVNDVPDKLPATRSRCVTTSLSGMPSVKEGEC